MPSDHYLTRRTVLCAGGAGAAGMCAFVLTGCGSSSSSKTTTSAAAAASPSRAPATSSAASSSAASSSAAAPSTSAKTSGETEGTEVIKLSAVPVGGSASAMLKGNPIIVSQPSAGHAVAFSAICTHQGCTVNPGGATLNCPCHGSTYNAFTGQNMTGPAPSPLPAFPVTVSAGAVFAHA
jgi:cytochrome b6-f complex iron-sulfur subunit